MVWSHIKGLGSWECLLGMGWEWPGGLAGAQTQRV